MVESPSPSSRPQTALDLAAGYEASQQQQQTALPSRSPSAAPAAPAAEREEEVAPPGAVAVFLHTLPRYLPQVFHDAEQTALQICLSLATILFLLACIVVTFMTAAALVPLPRSLALPRNQFYQGLKVAVGAADSAYTFETYPGNATADFEHKFKDLVLGPVEKLDYINRTEFEGINKQQKDDLMSLIKNLRVSISQYTNEKIDTKLEASAAETKEMLLKFKAFADKSLSSWTHQALINLINNSHRAKYEINFFSIGMGAIVNPSYTSRTSSLSANKSWILSAYNKMKVFYAPPRPAIVALQDWQEGGDCWCAEHDSVVGAKAQLTIDMPEPIIADALVLEHIPSKGTLNIAAAPKDWALWAQVTDEAEADRLRDGDRATSDPGECGEPPKGEKNWICLTNGAYDIHGKNHVQDRSTSDYGVPTKRLAFRVLTNWGAPDHTCIYRVRAVGRPVEKCVFPAYTRFGTPCDHEKVY